MNFNFEDQDLAVCQQEFNRLPPEDRLFYSHYDLAEHSDITNSALWKNFLTDKRVSDWLNQEITLFKDAQLRKLIKDATKNDRSTGAAQMLNALNKPFTTDTAKEGKLFVYSYVPLNKKEQGAPDTHLQPYDLFEEEEQHEA